MIDGGAPQAAKAEHGPTTGALVEIGRVAGKRVARGACVGAVCWRSISTAFVRCSTAAPVGAISAGDAQAPISSDARASGDGTRTDNVMVSLTHLRKRKMGEHEQAQA